MNSELSAGSKLGYRWTLPPALETERRELQAEHAGLEDEHQRLKATPHDATADALYREKLDAHVARLNALLERLVAARINPARTQGRA
jgi:hypothetical protein